MVKEKMLEKVPFSLWATPLVVVVKPNGDVRLYADKEVTLNSQPNIERYPFPTTQDVFATLDGGKISTKLDHNKAYQQLKQQHAIRAVSF